VITTIFKARRFLARRRLLAEAGVSIAPDSKVFFERIAYQPGSYLRIGKGSIVEANIIYDRPGATITVGNNTYIGVSKLCSAERIEFGNDILMAWGGTIVDHDSHPIAWSQRSNDVRAWFRGEKDWTNVTRRPVRILDKAWIGFNVTILKGITVGEGAIVGAGSVVTKDVAPFTIVAGNPARMVRQLEPESGT